MLEIYDLAIDPNETTNLAATRWDLVDRATSIFAREHTNSKEFPFPTLDQRAVKSTIDE